MIRTGSDRSHEGWEAPAAAERRRLWQTLNPLHRKYIYILARALALRQQPRLHRDAERMYEELSRHIEAIERLLDAFAPRSGNRSAPRTTAPVDWEDLPG